MKVTTGAAIVSERVRLGLTQEQLAASLGKSTITISNWECDKTAPTLKDAAMLADTFGCSVDYLCRLTDERTR